MKIPELRTVKFKLSALPLNLDYSPAVVDESGRVVAVFFGNVAPILAEYLTSWTDVMKLAQAQVRKEDQAVAENTLVETPQHTDPLAVPK